MSKLQRALAGDDARPDFSNEGLAARAAAQEAEQAGSTADDGALAEAEAADGADLDDGAGDTGGDVDAGGSGADAGTVPDAGAPDGGSAGVDEPGAGADVVTKLADGSYLIGGKYKGATLDDAIAASLEGEKHWQSRVREKDNELKQAQAERDQWAMQQQTQSAQPSVAARMQAENQVRAIAQENPNAAAELALQLAVETGDQDLKLYTEVVGDWMEHNPKEAWAYDRQVQTALGEARVAHREQVQYQQVQHRTAAEIAQDNAVAEGWAKFADGKGNPEQREAEIRAVLEEYPQLMHVEPTADNLAKSFEAAWRMLPPASAADQAAAQAAAQGKTAAAQAASRNAASSLTGAGSLADDVGSGGTDVPNAEQEEGERIRNGILNKNRRKTPFWATAE